jgi:hypothetical protein
MQYGVRFPTVARDFSLLHGIQTGYGAHAVPYPMGTGRSFQEDKATGARI